MNSRASSQALSDYHSELYELDEVESFSVVGMDDDGRGGSIIRVGGDGGDDGDDGDSEDTLKLGEEGLPLITPAPSQASRSIVTSTIKSTNKGKFHRMRNILRRSISRSSKHTHTNHNNKHQSLQNEVIDEGLYTDKALGFDETDDGAERERLMDLELQHDLNDTGNPQSYMSNPYTDSYSDGLDRREFQVSFTIMEARLTGLNINPMVCVQVGNQKQFTSTKQRTQSPEWHEIYHSRKLLTPNEVFGTFVLDVATVYAQPGHQFHHKWAVIVDPKDMAGGAKGYLKCNISVHGGDDADASGGAFVPPPEDTDENNIEANLLLPVGGHSHSQQQQQARFSLRLYSAVDVPVPQSGLLGSVQRAISSQSEKENLSSVSNYIQVSFAGHSGSTSTRSNRDGDVAWNEEIVFLESFPPLVRRLRVQLFQKNPISTTLLATHFIDMAMISDKGPRGFLPTIGPTWTYLYGSIKEGLSIARSSSGLDQGLGEGVSYKGRLLMAFRVELINSNASNPRLSSGVLTQRIPPLPQGSLGSDKEFLLFGCVMDVNMIDKKYVGRSVQLEISMGKEGLTGDEHRIERHRSVSSDKLTGSQWDVLFGKSLPCRSTTPKIIAKANSNNTYGLVPFGDSKPCLGVWGKWQDFRFRLFNTNYLIRIATTLEQELNEVEHELKCKSDGKTNQLTTFYGIMDKFMMEANKYMNHSPLTGSATTQLDRERQRICQNTMDKLSETAKKIRGATGNSCLNKRLIMARKIAKKIKEIAHEPQDSLPDIVVWLVYDKKRIAYHRIKARELIFSMNTNERGPLCSKLHSFYLKVIEQTLNPCWDETIEITEVVIHGEASRNLQHNPSNVVVEIFDQDKIGEGDFIGQVVGSPWVKLIDEEYARPRFPPKLRWYPVFRGTEPAGEILAAFELIQLESDGTLPNDVPRLDTHRHRDNGVSVICVPSMIRPPLARYRLEVIFWGLRDLTKFNFFSVKTPRMVIEVSGQKICSQPIMDYFKNPNFTQSFLSIDIDLPQNRLYWPAIELRCYDSGSFGRDWIVGGTSVPARDQLISSSSNSSSPPSYQSVCSTPPSSPNSNLKQMDWPVSGVLDWWSKYFASLEDMKEPDNPRRKKKLSADFSVPFTSTTIDETYANNSKTPQQKTTQRKRRNGCTKTVNGREIAKLRILEGELENVPEYGGFTDALQTFPLYRGRDTPTNRADDRLVGKFKAINLHPADVNGKADPYLCLSLGKERVNDRENYISKQLNPVFGKCFQFLATFPQEGTLKIQVKDWDMVSSDDLIGETTIDLEARYYSHHRATCGLPYNFNSSGYNGWRDAIRPSGILQKLCLSKGWQAPSYSNSHVRINGKLFVTEEKGAGDHRVSKEELALMALHRWTELDENNRELVAEHVESRPLYNPSHSGLLMGRLQIYELRVTIWNTEDVVLDDDNFFSGEKMSDIYVKGWLHSPDTSQSTDIHYRSLTGEGNFNWRFIFPLDYLEAEGKLVWSRRETRFSIDKTQVKQTPILTLQVWDADYVLPDDFLGSLQLNLNRFPRGSKSPLQCTSDIVGGDKVGVPTINLFEQRRIKGWWPFINLLSNGQSQLTGKVELEMHLLTKEEAEESPVGLGRSEPNPLPEPNRPDNSFMWFMNPMKSLRFVLWKNHKYNILKAAGLILFVIMLLLFLYSLPGYTVKKILGA